MKNRFHRLFCQKERKSGSRLGNGHSAVLGISPIQTLDSASSKRTVTPGKVAVKKCKGVKVRAVRSSIFFRPIRKPLKPKFRHEIKNKVSQKRNGPPLTREKPEGGEPGDEIYLT
jgi:hypothetical protein